MDKENKINIGLWTKTSKTGTQYASGKIKLNNKEYKIVLFKVREKKTEKSPDFSLVLEEIKEKNSLDEKVFAEFGDLTEIDDSQLAF